MTTKETSKTPREDINNGLLPSAMEHIQSNLKNPDMWKRLADSPKYGAKYTTRTLKNGILVVDMELKDGSFISAVGFISDKSP